jgi:hypothetical protein
MIKIKKKKDFYTCVYNGKVVYKGSYENCESFKDIFEKREPVDYLFLKDLIETITLELM